MFQNLRALRRGVMQFDAFETEVRPRHRSHRWMTVRRAEVIVRSMWEEPSLLLVILRAKTDSSKLGESWCRAGALPRSQFAFPGLTHRAGQLGVLQTTRGLVSVRILW